MSFRSTESPTPFPFVADRGRHRPPWWILLVALALFMTGCKTPTGPYAAGNAATRNPLEAQRLALAALPLVHTSPADAERMLQEALAADLYHGPAHNNLGAVYLGQGRLYAAATEFEWARKLMPGHPDPRLNLAMTLERAGRIDQAMATYDTALDVYPGHLQTVQSLVRCQLRYNRTDDRTAAFLEIVALQGDSEQWRRWARRQQIRLAS